jgi:hypothetical protein
MLLFPPCPSWPVLSSRWAFASALRSLACGPSAAAALCLFVVVMFVFLVPPRLRGVKPHGYTLSTPKTRQYGLNKAKPLCWASSSQSALRGGCLGGWAQFGEATEVRITSPTLCTRARRRSSRGLLSALRLLLGLRDPADHRPAAGQEPPFVGGWLSAFCLISPSPTLCGEPARHRPS